MGIPEGLTEGDTQGVHRSPSQEPCDRGVSTMWLDPEPAPSGTGMVTYGLEGLQLASGAPFHLREPKGGLSWESSPKCARCTSKASGSYQHPFEEGADFSLWPVSKSPDEVSEMRLIRLIISQDEGGQAKPTSSNDTPGHSRTDIRQKFLLMRGPCLSTPQRLTSGVERQGIDDPEVPSKKPESMIRGKAEGRPSYLPLVAVAGGLPKANPRKVSKQKTSQWRAIEVAPGSFFPPWWQRDSGGLEDPATFPPISDVLLPGRGRRHSLVPFETKESKPTGTGPKSMTWRRRVSRPVVGEEDKEEKKDGFPESQSLTQGQRLPFPCGHHGPRGTGTMNNRHTQDLAHSEPLALLGEEVLASGPAPSSDLDLLEEPRRPKRLQKPQPQQPLGAEGCPWCCHLQKEISCLKQHCAALQSLIEKLLRH
ncbi:uncharacterized protein CXorf49 homolog isoform X1 [Phyllostomus hastatus]|uniref:uncharacterized protein CXorf49 homolog isoform X1 n=2 Tax=Phyllostomus hastatus TaxID=9423 RepID=UPI001E67ECA3|nr:uncharacterized protein CXorf49 homolog isoform X1 [Phyllostomus hastatus]